MPGWWYTIESTTTKHLLRQFEHACREALSSDRSIRELMRAKSAKQRFPVIEWIRKLDKLQVTAIRMCERSKKRPATPIKTGLRGSLQKLDPTSKSSHGTKQSRNPIISRCLHSNNSHCAPRHSSSWFCSKFETPIVRQFYNFRSK